MVQVKGNQPQLLADCKRTAANETPVETFTAPQESAHGRKEDRSCRVFDCTLTTDPEWQPLITQIVEIHRVREEYDTKKKQAVLSEEVAFFASTVHRTAEDY